MQDLSDKVEVGLCLFRQTQSIAPRSRSGSTFPLCDNLDTILNDDSVDAVRTF